MALDIPTAMIGVPVKRRENPSYITGAGKYTDVVQLRDMAHMVLLRNPHAHARILKTEELPSFETARTVNPSPHNPIGANGVGEMDTIGGAVTVVNAVVDALRHLSVTDLDMPVTAEKV